MSQHRKSTDPSPGSHRGELEGNPLSPQVPGGHHFYGSRGFAATGHGSGDHAGLGAFHVGEPSRQQPHEDPLYQQWREEQMRRFDEDFRQWHQERYQSLSTEPKGWRSRSNSQDSDIGTKGGK